MAKINLGDEVVDTISGFRGTVVAIHMYVTGCNRCSVQPKVGKDGKLPDAITFDEITLNVTKAKVTPEGDRSKGGPAKFSDRRRY